MHLLYSLRNRKTLFCVLYRLVLLQLTQQLALQKRSLDEPGGNLDLTNRNFDGPVIVLMSRDTVSVAQLPMILYGNLTEVYTLAAEHREEQQDNTGVDDETDESEREDSRSVEDDDDDSAVRFKTNHENGHVADARELEQMPHRTGVNTTTSLGKSEWQQIAVGARDQAVGSLPEQASKKIARNGPTAEGTNEDGDDRGHLGRRPRRSNSLTDHHDDSSVGAGASQPNGIEPSSSANEENSTSDAPADQRAPSRRAQESSGQNVTSAAFAGLPQQRQPNPATTAGAPAEEDDKISPSPAAFSSSPLGPSASSPAAATSSSQEAATAPLAAGPRSNRVHFSDFDVHMSLGYAFVADSAGRIHKFRLPVGLKSYSTSRGGLKLRYASYDAKGTNSNGESVAIVNDETANTIDAGNRSGSPPIQSKVVNAPADGSPDSARRDANHHRSGFGPLGGHTSNRLEDSYDDANKVRSGQSNGAVTHEQTEKESQHPAISGERDDLSSSSTSDSPVSGTSQFGHRRQSFNAGVENSDRVDDVKPRIIWSRSKYARRPNSGGRLKTGQQSAKHSAAQQQLAGVRGALPHKEMGQLVDTAQTTDARMSGARSDPEGRQFRTDLRLGDEAQRRPNSGPGTGNSGGRVQASTEIAVDWLNNLLFVLDKCRLLVMDFDGNNELILIDDFNANNRPVDIKLDPVNDFLFWLQVGRFHNTIYKLDLSVLTMPSATQRLVSNTLRLRQSNQVNASANDNGLNFDASELVPLVSRHYAHPIITNLPRHAKIFTIDHRQSRIYVPLSAAPSPQGQARPDQAGSGDDAQSKRDDAEIFAPPTDDVTHLNNTQSDSSAIFSASDCSQNETETREPQILAYNLDGTDVGPLRTLDEKSHMSSLDGIEDLTLNSEDGLLYWLVNEGRDLFEEFRENSTIQPAQHYLLGKSYSKLMYFDDNNANQPATQKSKFNVRKIIHLLSSSIASNRQTRSGSGELDPAIIMGLRNSDMDTTRNAPYIILGVTCLVVTTVYLIYALIFQRIQAQPRSSRHSGDESISGDSSIGAESQVDDNLNGFVNSTTISRWVAGPSERGTDASTFDRDINSFNRRLGSYDLESTNYEASNAVDDHYRGNALTRQTDDHFKVPSTSRLANLSEWPTNMHDLSNKLYVPVEVLQDEALSSIQRVSIDQLDIERKSPLGEGHFGTVLEGTIDCAKYNLEQRQHMAAPCRAPISPDSLAPPSSSRVFAPSTSSSGHGSSSSTSCEFATAHTDSVTNRDDYLTPRNQLSSTGSDYGVEMPASTVQDGSCSGYCDTQVVRSFRTTAASLVGTKLKVAIKKLKDNASPEEKRDFLQEAKLLANFNHPNIVHLIGICLDRGSTLIIMELMLGGDLIRYMQENTPSPSNNYSDDLTYDDLLKICLDIANGCCYLEDMDYIHRDLAARNCLVSSKKREERVVKLADFGLARDIYKDSYYKKLNDSAMPLKWMAPECLIEQKFTKKSDVWSFGVVMWEVMSYCQEKPYSGVEPFFMKEHLASGARLRKPDCCDDSMYRLMNQCWQVEPDNRPTFHECRAMLIELRNIGPL